MPATDRPPGGHREPPAPRRSQRWPEAMTDGVQFEVIPLAGVLDEARAHLPAGARLTVTASPRQGLEATVATACALAAAGFSVVPHLAARQIPAAAALQQMLDELADSGIKELFVIAGDASQPAGPFEGALDLLTAIGGSGHDFRLGVGAYPEHHPFAATPAAAMDLLQQKAQHASYLVTQLCFDADTLLDWLRALREHGIELPVRPGIAGPIDLGRLLRIGTRVGVGPSLRLLAKRSSGVRQLIGHGSWSPDPLLAELAPAYQQPTLALAAPHVFTFNALETTGAWWRALRGAKER
ncbi:methylenetetrahydrofolate reductase [Brachybacterium sp. UNK5269]|uniref:methylenetetrahydrofolate reductase n=1 Tax=Brachybacterium sp. UNK5269 TaxID=3408576 RepID=UPI003BB044AF